jgi:hypothetical protein
MSSCVCTKPDADNIPIWRDGQGANTRLVSYLKTKKDQHKGSAPHSPEEMRSRQTLWTPRTPQDWAICWVRKNYFIFPCLPKSKAPATEHGFKDASNDEKVVRAWWKQNPNYNPAISLGPSNLVVRDFDTIKPTVDWPSTFTVKTGRLPVNGIDGIQMYYLGSCKTHGVAGGEVRSRGAYVLAPGSVHPSGNVYQIVCDLPLAVSPEQNVEEVKTHAPAVGSDEQNAIADYLEGAFEVAGIDYQSPLEYEGGFKWLIACPWKSEHTTGKDFDSSSAVIMWSSGKLIYECKHGHCQGIRQWKELRAYMEEVVGHFLTFGPPDTTPVYLGGKNIVASASQQATSKPEAQKNPNEIPTLPSLESYLEESDIPPFDPSVISEDSILRRFVDLVSKGTGIPDQFAFAVAKAVLGIRMDGIVKFADYSLRTNLYVALIGATGTGKNSCWDRTREIITPVGGIGSASGAICRINFLDTLDSGAGLKDAFFEKPDMPILAFHGEVEELGAKTGATRQPEILTTLIDLKDNTRITRALARQNKKEMGNARLGAVLCGQEGAIFTRALAGRTKLGLWDRMYPEFATLEPPTKLPPISAEKAVALLTELNSLDYAVTMSLSEPAKQIFSVFWNSLPAKEKNAIRLRNAMVVDAFIMAFARHATEVSTADALAAVKIAYRQLIIRKVCFTTEVPDKTGYYSGLIKKSIEKMKRRIDGSESCDVVAMSERDFLTATNAYRDNEEHFFKRAWDVLRPVLLSKHVVVKANGQKYEKWRPQDHDDNQ